MKEKLAPSILTLITTYMCTSSCENCCFECNPVRSRKMSFEEMKEYVDNGLKSFSSIQTVVFTGGECTLLKQDLLKIIRYCTDLNLTTRIVTNGYWARNQKLAVKMISSLVAAGLKEILVYIAESAIRNIKK